ncbi:hypothetical protein SMBr_03870 [Shewanella sp. M-Br]|nr:hypothetical protein SMBr_03870 [Shewanella sp. M-Br]
MHMPGVIETKKKVGINTASKAKSGMVWSFLGEDEKVDSVMKTADLANLLILNLLSLNVIGCVGWRYFTQKAYCSYY